MIRRVMIAAGMAAALAMPATAAEDGGSCEALLKQVETAATQAKLDDAARKRVEEAKARAMERMKAGDEAGCKETATQLLQVLKG